MYKIPLEYLFELFTIDDLWPMVSFLSISVRITTLIELRIWRQNNKRFISYKIMECVINCESNK